jgi:glycine betaine/proline transport system substrate-binding protein
MPRAMLQRIPIQPRRLLAAGLVFLVVIAVIAGVLLHPKQRKSASNQGTVTIAVLPWVGYEANAAVVSTILETRLNYTVVLKQMTSVTAWAALEQGEIDVILENWDRVVEKRRLIDELHLAVSAGTTGNTGVIGWYLPIWMIQDYPDILDWRNLNRYASLFASPTSGGKGEFLQSDPNYYNYDLALISTLNLNYQVRVSGSEAATVDMALAATQERKPLLFYFWEPHYLFQRFHFAKIQLPEYTDGCYSNPSKVACGYPVEHLDKIVTSRFAASGGRAYQFIKNFNWTNPDQNEVANYLVEKASYRTAALTWMEAHPDSWSSWLPPDQ